MLRKIFIIAVLFFAMPLLGLYIFLTNPTLANSQDGGIVLVLIAISFGISLRHYYAEPIPPIYHER
jgi:hypothetical protein